MRMWLKGTEQLKKKKKKYCENSRSVVLAVLTPPSPFASWELPSRSWCPPPSLRGLLVPSSVCPFLSHCSGSKLGSVRACCQDEAASPGAGPCHLGTATHLACPHLGSWGSLGSPHTGNGHTSLNARG